jgi:hypothetical protein
VEAFFESFNKDPRLLVATLGGILIGVGLIWVVAIEIAKRFNSADLKVNSGATWPDVVLYICKVLPPDELVPVMFIAIGAALAFGAVWNAPAAAGGAAAASPSPK